MKAEDLKGKKITVMGLGLHGGGVGTVKFLAEAGARVVATDIKTGEELASSLAKIRNLKNVELVLGQHRQEDFSQVDMVIKNPGVSWSNQHIKIALENKIPVEIDASLFFKLCQNRIIGVTGTKGKTTTASLIFEILKTSGKEPVKVGVGQVSVLDKLKDLKKDSLVVFELSSWRLSGLGRAKISPQIAVWTNFYPDHLNYYKDLESYKKDKKYIFSSQSKEDFLIVNWDQEVLRMLEGEAESKITKFSTLGNPGGNSVYLENGSLFWNDGIDKKKIIDVEEIKLRGKHNVGNVLAAIGATLAVGVKISEIKKAVSAFPGIPHRLEWVREFQGVNYFNDTAATTPESAISGIDSFEESLILITGGTDKNLEFRNLAEIISQKPRKTILLKGTASDKIVEELKKIGREKQIGLNYLLAFSMEEAISIARSLARRGEVVLLSPGAASFGMFKNEFDRGDKFKEAVKDLK